VAVINRCISFGVGSQDLPCVILVYYVQHWDLFFQIVGVTEAEVKAAHRWRGNGITNLLAQVPEYVSCLFQQL